MEVAMLELIDPVVVEEYYSSIGRQSHCVLLTALVAHLKGESVRKYARA
jgi:hypothetical protein